MSAKPLDSLEIQPLLESRILQSDDDQVLADVALEADLEVTICLDCGL